MCRSSHMPAHRYQVSEQFSEKAEKDLSKHQMFRRHACVMRTSPCCTRTSHGLPQVTIRHQLGRRVRFGFNRHPCTVSAISPSYDIEMRRSLMRWNGDATAVLLVLVLDPEGSWIILCDHDKVLRHQFWANLALYRVGP
uniref:Uncharacterized protein n=1 Tax=Setaria viridis TaxID=4556 RepID=A0A4V6DCY1_SETVI|nr:hypothetical protein SEVIR_1G183100v2 [Setaria viridis]